VGGVRRETTQNDVFEKILQDFEGLARPEAVANQHPWFLVSSFLGLGIKYTLEPLQAGLGVGISRFGARILPSGGGERGPVASMVVGGWPNNHEYQIPTVSTDALDRSHRRSLDTRCKEIYPALCLEVEEV
jgi:hypothetical protein